MDQNYVTDDGGKLLVVGSVKLRKTLGVPGRIPVKLAIFWKEPYEGEMIFVNSFLFITVFPSNK